MVNLISVDETEMLPFPLYIGVFLFLGLFLSFIKIIQDIVFAFWIIPLGWLIECNKIKKSLHLQDAL